MTKLILKTIWYILLYGIDGAEQKVDEEYEHIKAKCMKRSK